jgi:hypothetical protein
MGSTGRRVSGSMGPRARSSVGVTRMGETRLDRQDQRPRSRASRVALPTLGRVALPLGLPAWRSQCGPAYRAWGRGLRVSNGAGLAAPPPSLLDSVRGADVAKPFQFLSLGILAYTGAGQALAQVCSNGNKLQRHTAIGMCSTMPRQELRNANQDCFVQCRNRAIQR